MLLRNDFIHILVGSKQRGGLYLFICDGGKEIQKFICPVLLGQTNYFVEFSSHDLPALRMNWTMVNARSSPFVCCLKLPTENIAHKSQFYKLHLVGVENKILPVKFAKPTFGRCNLYWCFHHTCRTSRSLPLPVLELGLPCSPAIIPQYVWSSIFKKDLMSVQFNIWFYIVTLIH